MEKRVGERGWDTMLNISRILYSMGLPLQEFHDEPDIEWIKEQLDLENRTGIREQTSSDVESRYEYDQETDAIVTFLSMDSRSDARSLYFF